MRFLSQLKLAGTRSFRLATSALFDWGGNCITGDTEVLTAEGWKRLDTLGQTTSAMCWSPNEQLTMAHDCKVLCHPHQGKLYAFNGVYHTLLYTANHRIPYRSDCRFSWIEGRADELYYASSKQFPVSGTYQGTSTRLTPDLACLIVALQADFTWEGANRWRGYFMKPRKIKRIKELIEKLGLQVSWNKPQTEGYVRPSITVPEIVHLYLDAATKTFQWSILEESMTTRQAFLDELAIWDGSPKGNSVTYCNTNVQNIFTCQTLAHITHRKATFSVCDDNNRGYGRGENKILYRLNISPKHYLITQTLDRQMVDSPPFVYCLQTPTGYFMTRRNGVIQITGNSQNMDKETMDVFEAPPGWSIVQVDQAGAEAMVVAYLVRPGKYRDLFIHGVKAHTYVALHLFIDKFRGDYPKERYWLRPPDQLKALPEWPQLLTRIAGTTEYDIGKRSGLAFNYDTGPNTFREAALKDSEGKLNLTYEEAKFYRTTYRELFPEIPEWHGEIEYAVRNDRVLKNLFGYPRRFERQITDGYIREAISWIPQSTVGCITHLAYRSMYDYITRNHLSWRLFNNKHDSYAALVPSVDVSEAAARMCSHINLPLIGRDGAPFTMRSEAQVGRNLKKYHPEKNPEGLKEVKI